MRFFFAFMGVSGLLASALEAFANNYEGAFWTLVVSVALIEIAHFCKEYAA